MTPAALVAVLTAGLAVAGSPPAGSAPGTPQAAQLGLDPATAQPAGPRRGLTDARLAARDAAPPARSAQPGQPGPSGTAPREHELTPAPAAEVAAAADGSLFTAVAPVRVLDTRDGTGGVVGPVGPAGIATLDLSSRVPADATAVVLNVTGTGTTSYTYVTVYPSGQSVPEASNLNLVPNQTRPNAVVVALGTGRRVELFNFNGNVHLVADLAGWYAPGTGNGFFPVRATRVLDTRESGGPVGPNGVTTVDLSGMLAAGTSAVTVNLTGVGASVGTFVTAWPAEQPRPTASNLNLTTGQVASNQATVALGPSRRLNLYNFSGSVHLIVDLAGSYAASGQLFFPLAPTRVLDTRPDGGLPEDSYGDLPLYPWLPEHARAAVVNLTGVAPTAPTFVTAWMTDGSLPPNASTLNLAAGEVAPNLATVPLDPSFGQSVALYNRNGYVDLVMDLAGYFGVASEGWCTSDCPVTWGDNSLAQLGNGTTGAPSSTPGPVHGNDMQATVRVTAGELNTYALRNDSSVWAWGRNDFQGLGNGLPYGMAVAPVRMPLVDIQEIAANGATAYALGYNGLVWGWGYNADGEIGDGTTDVRIEPAQVSGLTGVRAIAAGYNNGYALRSDGTVWAWGVNGGGLGNGSYGTGCDQVPVAPACRSAVPVQVSGLTNVVAIAASWFNAFAIRSDGTVWAWGWNAEGELGVGTAGGPGCYDNPSLPNCVAVSPVQVSGLSGVTSIAGGVSTAYARKADGTVVSWGWNAQGQLGNGTTGGAGCTVSPGGPNCFASAPVSVAGLTGVTAVAAGRLFALALRTGDTVWSWGDNRYGQLGRANATNVPTQVTGLPGVARIGAGGYVSVVVVGTP